MIGVSGLGITALSMRSMRGPKLLGLCGFATAGRFTVRLGKELPLIFIEAEVLTAPRPKKVPDTLFVAQY